MATYSLDQLQLESRRLGPLLESHFADDDYGRTEVNLALFCLVVGPLLSLVLLYQLFGGGSFHFGPILLTFFGAAALLAVGVMSGIKTHRNRLFEIQVYSDGLLWLYRDRFHLYHWDEVEAIWQRFTQSVIHYGTPCKITRKYWLRLRDGTSLKFSDNIKNVEQLGEAIQQAIVRTRLPVALQMIGNGGAVPFGYFSLSQKALGDGFRELPWRAVSDYGTERGIFWIRRAGESWAWIQEKSSKLPNLYLFMALIRESTGLDPGVDQP